MESRFNAKTHLALKQRDAFSGNVPKSQRTGKGYNEILHNHWGYSYFNTTSNKDLVETLDLNLSDFPTGLPEFVICKKNAKWYTEEK